MGKPLIALFDWKDPSYYCPIADIVEVVRPSEVSREEMAKYSGAIYHSPFSRDVNSLLSCVEGREFPIFIQHAQETVQICLEDVHPGRLNFFVKYDELFEKVREIFGKQ